MVIKNIILFFTTLYYTFIQKKKNVKVTKVIITLIYIEKQRETMNKAKVEKRKKKANLYRGNYQRHKGELCQKRL